ncbi:protease pro-enzyme activation domain-containing protein [Rhodanobacter sp. L36]|uniref:protease pro-enzyme activation domain-containing protein n=1 Tax=Rhodanobacter sp. L36 TaxID=1747221 RepID=UPI0020B11CE8|nr:protease pro-enzyme activation domain-containing protein [Rhodanobacter sp. L36]
MKPTTLRNSSFPALAMTISLALAAATVTSARASDIAAGSSPAMARATVLRPGDAFTGVLPHTQPMPIVVVLKLQNSAQLDSLIAAHQTLTSAQFSAKHSPTQRQAQAVATYLSRMGYTNVAISANRMLVSADGTVGTAQAAFQTSLARVQTREGRVAFANDGDAHLPIGLQDSVLAVIGLQNVYRPHILAQRVQPDAGVHPLAITSHNPAEFSSIYGGTGVATAAGVTIGIITEGPLDNTIADLNIFTDAKHLARVTTQIVGAAGPDQGGTIEWNLDSQDAVGAAGGQVGQLIFYEMATFENPSLVADFNTVVTANAAKIINVSLGECELGAIADGSAAASDQIFQAAVAQGQTFSISTGDTGADECGNGGITPSWPADSPYVVAVGGTLLDASPTTWNSEVVWSLGGGSPSTFEPKPIWQGSLVSGTKRGLPDVAFDGDPDSGSSIVIPGGGLQTWGGTSLAAPIFAGLWSRVLAVRGTGIGFAAPLLYQLPSGDFHDITVGNNGGESAKVGYDFASGRGSMILNKAILHLGTPPTLVVNFSATSSGLIAKFTDTSTDSAGTVVSRAWNFGDGGTSTAASASHIYSKAGTYNVVETVTDSVGYLLARTIAVTVGRR